MLTKTLAGAIKVQEQYLIALEKKICPDYDCEKCLMKEICTHKGIKTIECPQAKVSCSECSYFKKGKCTQTEIHKAKQKLNKLRLQKSAICNNSFMINVKAFDSAYKKGLEINKEGIVTLNGKQLFEIGGL